MVNVFLIVIYSMNYKTFTLFLNFLIFVCFLFPAFVFLFLGCRAH